MLVLDSAEEVIYCNQRHTDLLGISVEEAGGISEWLRRACPDDDYAEKVQQLWRQHIWQKQLTRTFSLKARDEKLKEIEFRPRLLDDGCLLIMMCDVTEAQRNRDLLAVVQGKYAAVFQHLPIGVAMIDRSGRFFDFNPALEKMLGYSRVRLMQRTLDELLLNPADRKTLRLLESARVADDRDTRGEMAVLKMSTADGGVRSVEVSVTAPDCDGVDGPLRTWFLRDVSDEVEMRDRLRASQEQNRALLGASRDAILLLNRHGRIEDLVLPPEGVLVGEPASWVGKEIAEMLPGIGASDFLSVGEVIRSGEPREFEFSTQGLEGSPADRTHRATKDAAENHFEVRIVRCGNSHAVAVVREVTSARIGDLALRREALISEHLQDAIVVCSPRGRIEDWNKAGRRVFGFRRHEILGCGLSKLYQPDDPDAFNQKLSQELNAHGRWAAETTFIHKNGEKRPCEVLYLPVEREGLPVSLVGIHRPIEQE